MKKILLGPVVLAALLTLTAGTAPAAADQMTVRDRDESNAGDALSQLRGDYVLVCPDETARPGRPCCRMPSSYRCTAAPAAQARSSRATTAARASYRRQVRRAPAWGSSRATR